MTSVPDKPPATRARPDGVLVRAVEEARAAAVEAVGERNVGEHVGVQADNDRVVTHKFVCAQPGYRGWHWSVTLARAPRQRHATVDEVVLLPGDDALVAPAWLPWADRVRPDDLRPGDLLPVEDDDPRLVPGWLVGDPATEPLIDESTVRSVADDVGLGRERVLSLEGRDDAAERWYDGVHGPATPLAAAAPARCVTCGFLIRIAGPMGTLFGVCANGMVGDDGQVVSFDHGCGGHSDVRDSGASREPRLPEPALDTVAYAPLGGD